jgi:hypothetical protein
MILSWHLPSETKENHKKSQSVSVLAKIQIKQLQNTSVTASANLLCSRSIMKCKSGEKTHNKNRYAVREKI